MGHVREPSASRLEAIDPRKSLVDIGMAGMRRLAQGIDDNDVEILEQWKTRLWNDIHVSQVGCAAEAKAGDFKLAMQQRNSLEGGSVDRQGFMAFHSVHTDAGTSRVFRLCRKSVVKDFLDDAGAGIVGIKRDVAVRMMKAEWPKVVESEDMVGVRMRVENCVDVAELFAQRLFAKIRAGVDKNAVVFPMHGDRGTRAAISRIGRSANTALAPERGYAHGCAAAQDGEDRLHSMCATSDRYRYRKFFVIAQGDELWLRSVVPTLRCA